MADPMDTLKSILGDDAEDKIRDVMGSLSGMGGDSGSSGGSGGGLFGNGTGPSGNGGGLDAENLEYLMQMRDIMSRLANSHSDSRANLLMSLKPYMRDNRKKSIDSAIRLLNISKLAGLFRL